MGRRNGDVMPAKESSAHYEAFCATCQISKSFLTPQGINFFRISHEGHNIEIRQPEGSEEIEREPSTIAVSPLVGAPVVAAPAKRTPGLLPDDNNKETIELKRLSVDMIDTDGHDVFRVIGFSGNFHTFFRTFELAEVSEVEKFIDGGVHVDEYGNEYHWKSDSVEPTLQVKDLMNIIKTPIDDEVKPLPAEEKPEPKQAPKVELVKEEETPKEETHKAPLNQAPKPAPKHAPKPAPKPGSKPAPEAPTGKNVLRGPLLLGKFSQIEEGEEYSQEALKISKALGQFRWNIEPPYVIGALFDDIVSIQGQAGSITKDALEKVEELGYRFIAVDAPNGCVTAWFKKVREGDAESGEPYRSNAADILKLGSFRGAFSLGGEKARVKVAGDKAQP